MEVGCIVAFGEEGADGVFGVCGAEGEVAEKEGEGATAG